MCNFVFGARPLLSLNTWLTQPYLYSHRFNELSKRILRLSVFPYVLLTSLVPLGKIFLSAFFQIKSAFAWAVLRDFISSWLCLLDGTNGAFAFSGPCKNWLGLSAVKYTASSLTAVRGPTLRVCPTRQIVVLSTFSMRLCSSKIAIMIFCKCEQAFPWFHQNVGLLEDYTSKRSFSVLSHFQS